MRASGLINGRVITSLLLVVVIAAGGLVIWLKGDRGRSIEIALAPERELSGNIQVGGEVNNPGIYPFDTDYSIEDVTRMAGGVTGNANIDSLKLHVATLTENTLSQRIDINRAEAWLLEALPGIGETRARAIIEYREKNGLFRSTNELINVEGIGEALYEDIKHLVTVAD